MSISADTVSKKLLAIVSEGTKPFRAKLDKNTHVLDFSYNAIKVSDPKLTHEEYDRLINAISSSGKFDISKSITYTMRKIRASDTNISFKAFVDDAKYGTYLVTSTYRVMQATLASILKTTESTSSLVQKNEKGVLQANIGHIASDALDATRTPLVSLLRDLVKRVPLSASNNILQEVFNLQNAHDFEASYEFQRPDFDTARFNKILGKATVLVTLHSFKVNNSLATTVERPIITRIQKYLGSQEFLEHIMNSKGSLSIFEEIKQSIVATLTGKKLQSKHSKKSPSVNKTKEPTTAKLTVARPNVLPQIRNLQGQFYSLAALQILINESLPHVIAANMGNEGYPGGQRKILNYRTGRFATSARVERLSQSREGYISAFYTFMKNPYQTFSEGFAQGSPKTRDPKILISTSIKEIAATKVGARMRAVLI